VVLNVRKKRFLARLAGYGTNPVRRKLRVAFRREQGHQIGGHDVVLPPSHDLPFYQRRDPTYDSYAIPVLAHLAASTSRMLVVDLGANVGDTAVAALSAADNIDVVAVEGDDSFLSYLRRNVEEFGDRCRVVAGFVGPIGAAPVVFSRDGSTGGFQPVTREAAVQVTDWVSPSELLAGTESYDHIVWKSDIDGYDIHLLVDNWTEIESRCETIWFEYDPVSTLGDKGDIERLIDLLADGGRKVVVFDNLGRELVRLESGQALATGMASLTRWLHEQRYGHVVVPYVDVWALR
jgi:FkbM family methyltransferase